MLGKEYRYTFLPDKITKISYNNDEILLINSHDHKNIILYDYKERSDDNPLKGYYYNQRKEWSIYDKLDINPKTNCITCPITFNEIPFMDCIVVTCCWQGFDPQVFKELKLRNSNCPLCRQELTNHYLKATLDEPFVIGVNSDWSLSKIKTIMNNKLEYIKSEYRILDIFDHFWYHHIPSNDFLMTCSVVALVNNRHFKLCVYTSFDFKNKFIQCSISNCYYIFMKGCSISCQRCKKEIICKYCNNDRVDRGENIQSCFNCLMNNEINKKY